MTKLSELLEAGAAALAEEVGYFTENGHDDLAMNVSLKAKALRAIAPALVELVETKHAMQELDNVSFEYPTLVSRHRNAWHRLFTAMKEAGVTCE